MRLQRAAHGARQIEEVNWTKCAICGAEANYTMRLTMGKLINHRPFKFLNMDFKEEINGVSEPAL